MISTYSPTAFRIPVFTAAPLPLLYGCLMTRAPAAAAAVAVPSVEPSSTTSISRQAAATSSDWTTVPTAAASSYAGMTTVTLDGSATRAKSYHGVNEGAKV